jgi:hypothetical protein
MSCNDPIVMSQPNELCSRDRDAIALSVENLRGSPALVEFDKPPFSASHFPGHGFGPIPAPGSFAGSAFPAPPERHRPLP